MNSTTLSWPPAVTVKKHPRARHVKLKASHKHGLELVVPLRFNFKEIPFILEENRSWIEKQLKKLQAHPPIPKMLILPSDIIFPAIDQTWRVEYIASNNKLQLLMRPHQELVLLGNIENKLLCKKLLIAWMKEHARTHLIQELNKISEKTRLTYNNATIRDQSSRWGSCSATKSINLNYKLLLLPSHLANHILIHELCHTVHLDHSIKFWRLVASYDPNWEEHRRQLRKIEKNLPDWIKT